MLRTCLLLLAAAVCALAQTKAAAGIDSILDQGLTVPWRDDAVGHPDLIAFRDHLKKAVEAHDAQAILAASDPDFRGCDMRGLADLKRFLNGPSWSVLYKSLSQGGVLNHAGDAFDSNYAVWNFPMYKTGVFGPEYFMLVGDPNVPVLEHPDSASRVITRLSYNLVALQEPVVSHGWQRVGI